MSIFTLGRLKNHKITHLHPHSTMCMSRTRLQLKINNFFLTSCLFQPFTLGRQSEFVANLCDETQIFTHQTAVDSDFTQNFWVKIWRGGSLRPSIGNYNWNLSSRTWTSAKSLLGPSTRKKWSNKSHSGASISQEKSKWNIFYTMSNNSLKWNRIRDKHWVHLLFISGSSSPGAVFSPIGFGPGGSGWWNGIRDKHWVQLLSI